MSDCAEMEIEDLLKIILILVVVWMAVQIVFEIIGGLFALLTPTVGVFIIALIVLWYFDKI